MCEADNAADALVVARAFQPEAIVLDYPMATMSRAAVGWHLASDPYAGRLPIAFCTWGAGSAARAALPRKVAIFAKPCDSAELDRWLEGARRKASRPVPEAAPAFAREAEAVLV